VKIKKNITLMILGILFVFLFSCNKIGDKPFLPYSANFNNEIMVLLKYSSTPRGGFVNMSITNADSGRVVFSRSNVNQNRIVVLEKGRYIFKAENANTSAALNLQEDCKVEYANNAFAASSLTPPQAVRFRSGNNDYFSSLVDGEQYYLAILDIDDLNGSRYEPGDYVVRISGISAPIPMKTVRENNYIVSERAYSFRFLDSSSISVNVSVNGDTTRIPARRFNIIQRQPFMLTISNRWNNSFLPFAEMYFYLINTNDNFDAVMDDIRFNYIKDNYRRISAPDNFTDADGRIQVRVTHNDKLLIAVGGYPNYDYTKSSIINQKIWYTQTITVSDYNRNVPLNVIWPYDPDMNGKNGIPSKSAYRQFFATRRDRGVQEDEDYWQNIKNDRYWNVFLYYSPGKPINNRSFDDALNDPAIMKDNEGAVGGNQMIDNYILAWFNLNNVCLVTNINYFLEVTSSFGEFYTDRVTSDNTPNRPLLWKRD